MILITVDTTNSTKQVGVGRDQTLFALQPGFVKFYTSHLPFPHQEYVPTVRAPVDEALLKMRQAVVKRPRNSHVYVGIVKSRSEQLPRDMASRGRERTLWTRTVTKRDYLAQRVDSGAAAVETASA